MTFNYDLRQSYETNLRAWHVANERERRYFKQSPLSTEEGDKIFEDQYGQHKKSLVGWVLGSS
tara:strand:- start:463 stop:651 length:189 start_codon:yes stop_codon:yes gene_type:complete